MRPLPKDNGRLQSLREKADSLSQLRLLPGGNRAEESIPCGMVPFSPYMPPKTDWKLRGMMNAAEKGLKA